MKASRKQEKKQTKKVEKKAKQKEEKELKKAVKEQELASKKSETFDELIGTSKKDLNNVFSPSFGVPRLGLEYLQAC